MPFFLFDPTMLLVIPALLFALYAQSRVQTTFTKYLRVPARSGYTGAQVARILLDRAGLGDVPVEQTPQRLGDHYDPRARAVRLSPEVYQGRSLAALSVAAHETGHALQHAQAYVPLTLRSSLFPLASIGSSAAMPLFLIGLIFAGGGASGSDLGITLMTLGIWFFVGALLFQVVTLPVEFNASSRAMKLLTAGGFLQPDEVRGSRSVLNAAALTYVAAVAVSLMTLLRLLILRGMVSRD